MDGTLGGSSLAVISVADEVAAKWFSATNHNLRDIQTELDQGEMAMGFELPGIRLEATIDIESVTSHGRNVLALLPAYHDVAQAVTDGEPATAGGDSTSSTPTPMIVIGAHIDHLGTGGSGGSLAKEDERGGVHRGAPQTFDVWPDLQERARTPAAVVCAGVKSFLALPLTR